MSATTGGRRIARPGRHAAPKEETALERATDKIPTAQEVLLWEQQRRYRALDAIEAWWVRAGRRLTIGVVPAACCAIGGFIGAQIPVNHADAPTSSISPSPSPDVFELTENR